MSDSQEKLRYQKSGIFLFALCEFLAGIFLICMSIWGMTGNIVEPFSVINTSLILAGLTLVCFAVSMFTILHRKNGTAEKKSTEDKDEDNFVGEYF